MNAVTETRAELPDDAVEVARVVGAWGIKGWFRVQSYAADAQAVFASRRWYLQPAEGRPGPASTLPALLNITLAKAHGDGIVASAREVADRNAAEALKGARIFVSRASFPSAGSDEYYWVDLIGLQVINRQGELLGVVTDLLDTGAHSVLRLVSEALDAKGKPVETERMIPFVATYIDSVSLEDKRIVADWGLDY